MYSEPVSAQEEKITGTFAVVLKDTKVYYNVGGGEIVRELKAGCVVFAENGDGIVRVRYAYKQKVKIGFVAEEDLSRLDGDGAESLPEVLAENGLADAKTVRDEKADVMLIDLTGRTVEYDAKTGKPVEEEPVEEEPVEEEPVEEEPVDEEPVDEEPVEEEPVEEEPVDEEPVEEEPVDEEPVEEEPVDEEPVDEEPVDEEPVEEEPVEEEQLPVRVHIVTSTEGSRFTLTAVIENLPEGQAYSIVWQYSADRENWYDSPINTGDEMTVDLNGPLAGYYWRVALTLDEQ